LIGGFVALAAWRATGEAEGMYVGIPAFGAALAVTYFLQRLGLKPGWCWFIVAASATAAGAFLPAR